MIEVRDLMKKHGAAPVLAGVSFDVEAGSVAAVVGPSGGGKTTLLRCMHGLTAFDQGTVRVGETVLGPGAPKAEALRAVRARAGFVFQAFHLFAHRSVLENVIEAPIHVRRVAKAAAIAEAEALLEG